jgi:hypothetical protein
MGWKQDIYEACESSRVHICELTSHASILRDALARIERASEKAALNTERVVLRLQAILELEQQEKEKEMAKKTKKSKPKPKPCK